MIPKDGDLVGEKIGGYRIVGKLGKGGMATVYEAHELSLNRTVALKVLTPALSQDIEFVKRFKREAQAAAKLNHPNIVQIYSIGEDKGYYYFAMEHIKGKTLAQITRGQNNLPVEKALPIMLQVAEALGEAHKAGLVHRDVKPGNIMLNTNNQVKVTDFGIAYVSQAKTKLTREGSIIGTPEYLSPEQCEGKVVDKRSDIYSFGVTCYEVLTGKAPYEGETPVSILMKVVKGQFEPIHTANPKVPKKVQEIVEKMMKVNPDDRYSDLKEVISDLRDLQEPETLPPGMIVQEPPAYVNQGTGSRKDTFRAILVASVIVLLMGGAFAAKIIYFDKKSDTKTEQVQVLADNAKNLKSQDERQVKESAEKGQHLDSPGAQPGETNQLAGDLKAESGPGKMKEELGSGSENQQAKAEKSLNKGDGNLVKQAIGTGLTMEKSSPKASKEILPAPNTVVFTTVGSDDIKGLISSSLQSVLSREDFQIVDGITAVDNNRSIGQAARYHLITTVNFIGTTTLQYYGSSSEMVAQSITIKIVNPRNGTVIWGPVTDTVKYTTLNVQDNVQEVIEKLTSGLNMEELK
jgi:serine/threonine protein kinase